MSRLQRVLFPLFLAALCLNSVAAQRSREIRKTEPLKADGRLFIDTYKGSVEITCWDKPQVEIVARIEADDMSRYAEEKVEDTDVRIQTSGSTLRIKSDYKHVRNRGGSFWDIFDGESSSLPLVHYQITMPRTARLEIKDYKSELEVSGLRSDVRIETYKGTAEIHNLEGSLQLDTYKGEVQVEFVDLKGRSSVETYKGTIELRVPRNKGFDLDAELGRSARFDSDFDIEQPPRGRKSRDRDFRSSVNGGGPVIYMKSSKGTIRLAER